MATPLQKKVDAIQAKVDAQNAAKTPVTPLQQKVDAIQTQVDAQNLANPVVPKVNPTIEAIKAARAKVNAPTDGTVAPVNTAPLTAGQEIAKKNLENRPVPVDTTKIGTGVGENFVPYKGEQATVIPDTTGKVNADGTPIVPTPTEPKAETKAPTKPLETTTPSPVVVQNEDEAFKTLMAGGVLADTRENNAFKKTYGQFNYYNGLDNKTLSNKVAGGEVGSKFMNMLARFNPTKYAEVVKQSEDITKVNDINSNAQRLYNTANGTPQPVVTKTSDQMMQDLINGIETVPQKYSDIVAKAYADNPEIKEKADKLAVIDDKVDTIDTEIDKMYETYRTQYPDVPQAMLMGMVNRATYGLTQERNGLVKESKLLYSQYKDEKDQIDQGIQYDIAQQDKIDQRMFDLKTTLYGNKRADEIRDEDYARAEEQIKNDRTYTEDQRKIALEDNLKIALGDLGVKFNPAADYDTLLGQYADAKSADKTYERKLAADQLAESRNKIIPNVKPGEMIYENGKFITAPGGTSVGNVTPNRPNIRYETTANNGGVTVNVNAGYAGPEDRRTKYAGGYQCGQFVNDAAGIGVGDKLSEKLGMIDKTLKATPGAAFVEDIGNTGAVDGQPTGHIGLIEHVYDDGSFDVVEANYAEPGKVTRTTISPSDKRYNNIKGFVPTDLMKEPAPQPLDSNQRIISNQVIQNFQTRQKDFETALNQYRNLAVSVTGDPTGVKDLGTVYTFMKTLDPNSVVRETEFATAAAASGMQDRNTISQYYQKFKDGVILTGEQRDNMLKISKEFVKQRAERYDAEYEDAIGALGVNGISKSQIFFPKSTDFLTGDDEQSQDNTPELTPNEIKIAQIVAKEERSQNPNISDEELDKQIDIALEYYNSKNK